MEEKNISRSSIFRNIMKQQAKQEKQENIRKVVKGEKPFYSERQENKKEGEER